MSIIVINGRILIKFNHIRGKKSIMKVRSSVKADKSKGDQLVRRKGRLYVINKIDSRRKQRQTGPARKK